MLNDKDLELIGRAKNVIEENYDSINFNHTVGCAVRCSDDSIFTAVDMNCLVHGSCAPFIAIGEAESRGEREYDSIVCVKYDGEEYSIVPICGNCRQMLYRYAKNIEVIMNRSEKVRIEELLVYPGE